MTWYSIVQHFKHFDEYLSEGVYQHGCHLTGHPAASESSKQDPHKTAAEQTYRDELALIFGHMAARRPVSRTAFH